MAVEQTRCFTAFARLCGDGFSQGWHEANGGNLSYRMTDAEVTECRPEFSQDSAWVELGIEAPALGGQFFMTTGSGKYMRNVAEFPRESVGIVELSAAGDAYRIVWGLEGGGKPTSELPTHIMNHEVRAKATDGACRVIYHAHCPNIIALSTLVEPDAKKWTRILWKSMTECVIIFPQGVGVVDWMVPGGAAIARETAKLLAAHDAVVWTQHGMFVSGESFDAAFGLMHTIEKSAGLYLAARAANGGREPEHLITDAQLAQVCSDFGVAPNADFICA